MNQRTTVEEIARFVGNVVSESNSLVMLNYVMCKRNTSERRGLTVTGKGKISGPWDSPGLLEALWRMKVLLFEGLQSSKESG